MNDMTLPTHIGGYQHLENDVDVRPDDILVHDGVPMGFAADFGQDGRTTGAAEAATLYRVYRKYPVAKQSDAHAGRGAFSQPCTHETEIAMVDTTPKAATYDDGKPPLACLPLKALREVALVQLYGHKKYGDFFNYRKGMELSRNASCAMRHIADFMDGADLDSESKCNHLAHAACRILFMLENLAEGTAIDDRYKKEP